ncbi:MAG: PilZ domain-containing protein [Pseudomonadota bacterium]
MPPTCERRRADRFTVSTPCVVTVDGLRLEARLRDISGMGAYFLSPARPDLETLVVLQHPDAGRLEGRIARHGPDGFAIALPDEYKTLVFALKMISLDRAMAAPGGEA